jgi:hypothetical protein
LAFSQVSNTWISQVGVASIAALKFSYFNFSLPLLYKQTLRLSLRVRGQEP